MNEKADPLGAALDSLGVTFADAEIKEKADPLLGPAVVGVVVCADGCGSNNMSSKRLHDGAGAFASACEGVAADCEPTNAKPPCEGAVAAVSSSSKLMVATWLLASWLLVEDFDWLVL